VGTAVTTKPSVIVKDALGNPVPSQGVTYATQGTLPGTVTGATPNSDSVGVATITGVWTLSCTAGTNPLLASVTANSLVNVSFAATGTPGVAATIAINAGNGQSATAGSTISVLVIVRDACSNPISGATVTFAVTGTPSSASVTPSAITSANGLASGIWTLDTLARSNGLTASTAIGSGTGSVAFTATSTAGAAAKLTKTAGDAQSAPISTAVTTLPQVKVTDQYNNVITTGVGITFSPGAGSGIVTGSPVTSNVSGFATVGSWTLGATVGAQTLSAFVTAQPAVTTTFSATGLSPSPDLIVTAFTAPSTGTIGGYIDMSVTVKNQGTISAGTSTLKFYYSVDATITTADVASSWTCATPTLAGGASTTCSGVINVPPSLTPGSYFVGAITDATNAVTEGIESNNASAPVAISIGAGDVVHNGSFSAGDGIWQLTGNAFISTTLPQYFTSPGHAHFNTDVTGVGQNNANGTLYQDVEIPSQATLATLLFRYRVETQETTTSFVYDTLVVTVRNATTNAVTSTVATFSNLTTGCTVSYCLYSVNMTAFKGSTVRIYFKSYSDVTLPTIFRVDNVSLTWQ